MLRRRGRASRENGTRCDRASPAIRAQRWDGGSRPGPPAGWRWWRCVAGTLCGTAGAASADGAADIQPHRAGYELSLKSVRSGSGIIDVNGVLSYDWSDSCDGWIVEQRYVLQVVRGDGPVVEISASYANWESKDGLRYRFYVKRTRGGEDEDQSTEIQGEATARRQGQGRRRAFREAREERHQAAAGHLVSDGAYPHADAAGAARARNSTAIRCSTAPRWRGRP